MILKPNMRAQTMEMLRKDIQKSLGLNVENVDCYPLEIYSDTRLAKQLQSGEVRSVGDSDTEINMYLEEYNMFAESRYKPTFHNRFSRIANDFKEPWYEILGKGTGFFMGYLGKYSYADAEPAKTYMNVSKAEDFL